MLILNYDHKFIQIVFDCLLNLAYSILVSFFFNLLTFKVTFHLTITWSLDFIFLIMLRPYCVHSICKNKIDLFFFALLGFFYINFFLYPLQFPYSVILTLFFPNVCIKITHYKRLLGCTLSHSFYAYIKCFYVVVILVSLSMISFDIFSLVSLLSLLLSYNKKIYIFLSPCSPEY